MLQPVGELLFVRLTSDLCWLTGIQRDLPGLSPSRLRTSAACRRQRWCQRPSHLSPPGNKPPKNDPPHSLSGAWTPTRKKKQTRDWCSVLLSPQDFTNCSWKLVDDGDQVLTKQQPEAKHFHMKGAVRRSDSAEATATKTERKENTAQETGWLLWV